jgi:hypothetical protein
LLASLIFDSNIALLSAIFCSFLRQQSSRGLACLFSVVLSCRSSATHKLIAHGKKEKTFSYKFRFFADKRSARKAWRAERNAGKDEHPGNVCKRRAVRTSKTAEIMMKAVQKRIVTMLVSLQSYEALGNGPTGTQALVVARRIC